MLRVILWPQASKNSPKQLRASKKDLNWSYRPSKHLETFLLKSFSLRMSPNVFEINEDKIYKDKCCGEFYAMFCIVMLKKKNVGPVKILQDQQMLGVTGPTGPASF